MMGRTMQEDRTMSICLSVGYKHDIYDFKMSVAAIDWSLLSLTVSVLAEFIKPL